MSGAAAPVTARPMVRIGDLPQFARDAGVRHGHILVDESRIYMGIGDGLRSEVGVNRSYRWRDGTFDSSALWVATWEREVDES